MASVMEDKSHPSLLLLQLNDQRLQGLFCDITLVVEDTKFKAHRNVLAAVSPYFKELISSQTARATDQVLELPDVKAEVFADVLTFIYSSRVFIESSALAKELASTGKKLGIKCLENLEKSTSKQMDAAPCGQPSTVILLSAVQEPPKAKENSGALNPGSEEKVSPTDMWTSEASCFSQASVGSMSPIDLTASSNRRMEDSEFPPSASHFQSSPMPQDPSQSSPMAFASVSSVVQRQKALPVSGDTKDTLNGTCPSNESYTQSLPSDVDRSVADTNTMLHTLSTVALSESNSCNTAYSQLDEESSTLLPDDSGWDGGLTKERTVVKIAQSDPSTCASAKVAAPGIYPKNVFRCGLCNRSFSSPTALSLHLKLHRSSRPLACRYCNKTFILNKRLQTHEALCRQSDRIPVEEENSVNTGDQEINGTARQPREDHPAPPRKPKGHSHLLFRQRNLDLLPEQDHFVKVVDGHIIYFCTVCERSYMTLSSLKRHSNVHSWRRKYPCRYCNKVFALAEYRTKHEVWHTGERRYQCIFCWETFVTYYNLKTHQKAFHGINPRLITSEKTPNGGYKPKLNALKLYRLLPMRSQKRPYKTYSHSLSESVLIPPTDIPLSLTTENSPDNNKGLLVTAVTDPNQPSSLEDTEELMMRRSSSSSGHDLLNAAEPSLAATENAPFATSEFCSDLAFDNHEYSVGGLPGDGSRSFSKVDPCGASGSSVDGVVSTVIAYGHPTPSVIVHNTSVSSVITHSNTQNPSVIAYNNKVSQGSHASTSAKDKNQTSPSTPGPIKKQVLKEYARSQQKASCSTEDQRSKEKRDKGRSSNSKTMTYMAKPACVGATSESRSVPLCQITVRIGEEAIVKRRISETDLRRDTSPSSKSKRFDHGHKHNKLKSSHMQSKAEEDEKRADLSFGNDACDDESDRDAEDMLWRPYYSYKPKRKMCGVQKLKKSRWRRKLRYKRSLRWVKEDAEEKASFKAADSRSMEQAASQEESDCDAQEQEEYETFSCETCGKTFSDLSSLKKHEKSHAPEVAYECSTCSKRFSSLKKLRKHEKTHVAVPQFACEHCSEEFSTSQLLDEHRSVHRPKKQDNCEKATKASKAEENNSGQVRRHRAGRKPSVRHTCVFCFKVCKTAAALGRHMKLHDTEEHAPVKPASNVKESAPQNHEEISASQGQAKLTAVISYSRYKEQGEDLTCQDNATKTKMSVFNKTETRTSSASEDENAREMEVTYSSGGGTTPEEAKAEKCPTSSKNTVLHSCSSHEPVIRNSSMPSCPDTQTNPSQVTSAPNGNSGENSSAQETVLSYTSATASKGQPADQLVTSSHDSPQEVGRQTLVPAPNDNHEEMALKKAAPLLPADDASAQDLVMWLKGRNNESATKQEVMIGGVDESLPPQEVRRLHKADKAISPPGGNGEGSPPQKLLFSMKSNKLQEFAAQEGCMEPSYIAQEYPLPLIAHGSCQSRKEIESKNLVAYPSPLQFTNINRVSEEEMNVTFYPDPYPLMYGQQLLAYPYNFGNIAALPVALNMVIPDEKGQPLPFLPSVFGYVNPCRNDLQVPPVGLSGNPGRGPGNHTTQERLKKGNL
ncbi:zinc finger and BTB domain-containing protein 4 [Latimeria chalumnae]|uniref:zinc finger and BTB domain-containing protein 4 n=1 Tax=Latimeria chalumnae TaxID=7897 RepID=UPI0003C11B03|nr:PREDICTED: zinc finger and BTB domain-containing protein 4-like [Latimeria chalumnae]|eukprot:XP_005997966.1 PREDICTED: zinc finger and BTB domain-containing protein 4-like [Latimeria chalumnae]